MPLALNDAKELKTGDLLTFHGGSVTYEVVSVEPRGHGVHIVLRREDGYETHAAHTDLDVAQIVRPALQTPIDPTPGLGADGLTEEPADLVSSDEPEEPGQRQARGSKKAAK